LQKYSDLRIGEALSISDFTIDLLNHAWKIPNTVLMEMRAEPSNPRDDEMQQINRREEQNTAAVAWTIIQDWRAS
jgi:hypothetical protein